VPHNSPENDRGIITAPRFHTARVTCNHQRWPDANLILGRSSFRLPGHQLQPFFLSCKAIIVGNDELGDFLSIGVEAVDHFFLRFDPTPLELMCRQRQLRARCAAQRATSTAAARLMFCFMLYG
jgi:hypothetical protein